MGKKKAPLLTAEELELISTPIGNLSLELRAMAFAVRDKLDAAIAEENKNFVPSFKSIPNIISDYMPTGAGQAILNHADGKMYDSKSAYNKALKASGHYIVGNDKQEQKKELKGDFSVRDSLKQAIQQHLG